MYTFLNDYSNLHTLAGIFSGQDLRVVVETLFAPYKDGVLDNRGFVETKIKPVWDTTYAALLKEKGISFMAAHVAFDAYGHAHATKGVEMNEGNIPFMAAHRAISKDDYIKIMKELKDALDANPTLEGEARDTFIVSELQAVIGKFTADMILEHYNRKSYMRGQAVSKGKYAVTLQNNPNEFSIPEFDFKVPAANKTTLASGVKWWTDDAFEVENANATPVEDLRALVNKAVKSKKYKKSQLVIECDYWTLMRTATHSKVKLYIGTRLNPTYAASTKVTDNDIIGLTAQLSEEQLIAALEAAIGCKFETSDIICQVEVLNEKTRKLEPKPILAFDENVFVVRPIGNIGEIHSTKQLKVGGSEGADGVVTTLDGGKIQLTYKCNTEAGSQQWDSGEITLYVLTASKEMYYLTVA